MDWFSILFLLIGLLSLFILYRILTEFLYEIHNKIVLKNISKRDKMRLEILYNTSSDFVTFYKTHNREGKASHCKDYKTTCVRGSRSEENSYRDVVMDEHYIDILLSTMDKKNSCYFFETDFEKSCVLKDNFIEYGIKNAAIFYIKSNNSGVFYVIFAKKDSKPFSIEDISKFKEVVKKLRKLKNIYHKF